MEISRINQLANINFKPKSYKNEKTQSPISQNIKELTNNSLAEAIGRSQVSFKGESELKGPILSYQNVGKLTGRSENFIYNKEDGSIEYEEYTGNNKLKKRYSFHPAEGKEEVTLLQDDGTTKRTTKEPGLYKEEIIDEDEKPLFLLEADDDSDKSKSNRITVTYEYGDKAREIIRRYKNGEVSEIEVIDPRTGDVVTEGRLLESKFRRKDGWVVTKNIVNGDIYEKELKDQHGRRLQYEEYSRKTLALIHEFKTDNKTGETVETKFTEDGRNVLFTENKSYTGNVLYKAEYSPSTLKKIYEEAYDSTNENRTVKEFSENGIIVKQTITEKNGTTDVSTYDEKGNIKKNVVTSKNKREIDEYEFAPTGEIISDIHLEYNRKGLLQEKTVYVPGTEIIDTRTDYKNESTYTEYKYNTSSSKTNVPVSSESYEFDVLISEANYHEDGETISEQIIYGEDRFFTFSQYDKNGTILGTTYYTDKGTPYEFEKYNERGIVVKRVKDINSMNLRETTQYDEQTGKQTKFTRRTIDGKPILQVEYFSDGKTARLVREFNADGSYTRTEYDEFGQIVSKTNHFLKNQKTDSTETKPKEELIDSIAKKMGKPWVDVWPEDERTRNTCFAIDAITPTEMKALLEVTGFETQEQLFSMNKKQYRTVAKKFHTGQYDEKEELKHKFEQNVFRIVSEIYSNSPNEGV